MSPVGPGYDPYDDRTITVGYLTDADEARESYGDPQAERVLTARAQVHATLELAHQQQRTADALERMADAYDRQEGRS